MKKILFLTLIISAAFFRSNLYSQIKIDTSAYITVDKSLGNVISMGKDGLALWGYKDNKTLEITFFDSSFNQTTHYSTPIKRYENVEGVIYHNKTKQLVFLMVDNSIKARYLLVKTDKGPRSVDLKIKIKYIDFGVKLYNVNNEIWLQGAQGFLGTKSFIYKFNVLNDYLTEYWLFDKMKNVFILAVNNINNNKTFITYGVKENDYKPQIAVIDSQGNVLITSLLDTFKIKDEIQNLRTSKVGNDDYILYCEYGSDIISQTPEGIKVIRIRHDSLLFFNTYHFFDIKSFYTGLPEEEKEKLENSKRKGKNYSMRERVFIYQPVETRDGIFFAIDFFVPVYETEHRTKDVYGNNNDSYVKVLHHYELQHSLCVYMDNEGKILMDGNIDNSNGFKMVELPIDGYNIELGNSLEGHVTLARLSGVNIVVTDVNKKGVDSAKVTNLLETDPVIAGKVHIMTLSHPQYIDNKSFYLIGVCDPDLKDVSGKVNRFYFARASVSAQ